MYIIIIYSIAHRRLLLKAAIETVPFNAEFLLLTRVDKPALLRQLFELACNYSGQILSYTKMLGQLQDAGNTTTLAHYLELLAGAGMVCGLQRGRLVESAVGAHLANAAACGECKLFYWRERSAEVDFVVRSGRRVIAIEVKSTAAGRG